MPLSFVVFARIVKKKTGLMPTEIDPNFNYRDWCYDTQPEVLAEESALNFLRDEGYGDGDIPLACLALSEATAS